MNSLKGYSCLDDNDDRRYRYDFLNHICFLINVILLLVEFVTFFAKRDFMFPFALFSN